jgi:hypothetical protein
LSWDSILALSFCRVTANRECSGFTGFPTVCPCACHQESHHSVQRAISDPDGAIRIRWNRFGSACTQHFVDLGERHGFAI